MSRWRGYWIVNGLRACDRDALRVVAFTGPLGAPPIKVRQIMDGPPEV
ncbi:MAG TPA: hypothetical protein VET82_08180 [Candidatus Eisenbacteria bacterium]|jgi:hypothetical protein|nr:hypothetical protein [Candidatus Eisenbacteria bacterium]